MGSITSTRPQEIARVFGELDGSVYGIFSGGGHQTGNPNSDSSDSDEGLEGRARKNLSNAETRKLVKALDAELTYLNDIIFPYRKIRPSKNVLEDEDYINSMDNINTIIGKLPARIARTYVNIRKDYLREVQELSKRTKKSGKSKLKEKKGPGRQKKPLHEPFPRQPYAKKSFGISEGLRIDYIGNEPVISVE